MRRPPIAGRRGGFDCDYQGRDRLVERPQDRGRLLAPLIRSVDDRGKDLAVIGSAAEGTVPGLTRA